MDRLKWLSTFIAISVVALIGSAAGCVTIVTQPPQQAPPSAELPVIHSFTASPDTIPTGEGTTLTWEVTGATAITIEPEIGEVSASGSLLLSPAATTTYRLTASNEAGKRASSITVAVMMPTNKPDLVITEIWLTGAVINYKIRNQGNADADPTRAHLYVNELKQSESYVDILAAGEERIGSFANWQFLPAGPVGGAPTEVAPAEIHTFVVRVCADMENNADESLEGNNCLTVTWGQTFTYDFVNNAHLAKWRSSAGDLKWPMVSHDNKGAAYLLHETLVMCPEPVSNGWIMGRFADYYVKQYGLETTSREIVVPANAMFTAELRFEPGKISDDGVRVALGYLDDIGSVVLLPKMDVYSTGTPYPYVVDLSGLAGKKTEFVLWVEAKDSPQGDCIRWVAPKIVQQ